MKIEGKIIAAKIYKDLQSRVGELKKNGVMPHLTVILVGDNPASIAYVKQKQKWANYIKANITLLKYPKSVSFATLNQKINELNSNQDNHAILIQRPLPKQIDAQKLELLVNPHKDIDGFHPDSPYTLPLSLAVIKILEVIFEYEKNVGVARARDPHRAPAVLQFRTRMSDGGSKRQAPVVFINWLQKQNIVILGKGPTGGKPILKYLNKLGAYPTQIDTQTPNPNQLLKKADIIISAVGKPETITPEKIKKNVIIIGVGIYRDENGKLKGDYREEGIEKKASFYTPTPGGVGPVNVAMLMNNLLTAVERQTQT